MHTTETITTAHSLRTIILRVDPSKTAPTFETQALDCFRELHDRTLQLQQHIKDGRNKAFHFSLQIEEVEELFKQAKWKFNHLEMMIPENPEKETVRGQLKALLSDIDGCLEGFVQKLVDETMAFYDYDDRMFQFDQWMNNVAFPQFDEVFNRYEECKVDMVSFDRDLDDFKGVLSAVKRQEAKYYDVMNELIEHYSELNLEISDFFYQVESFDAKLV